MVYPIDRWKPVQKLQGAGFRCCSSCHIDSRNSRFCVGEKKFFRSPIEVDGEISVGMVVGGQNQANEYKLRKTATISHAFIYIPAFQLAVQNYQQHRQKERPKHVSTHIWQNTPRHCFRLCPTCRACVSRTSSLTERSSTSRCVPATPAWWTASAITRPLFCEISRHRFIISCSFSCYRPPLCSQYFSFTRWMAIERYCSKFRFN